MLHPCCYSVAGVQDCCFFLTHAAQLMSCLEVHATVGAGTDTSPTCCGKPLMVFLHPLLPVAQAMLTNEPARRIMQAATREGLRQVNRAGRVKAGKVHGCVLICARVALAPAPAQAWPGPALHCSLQACQVVLWPAHAEGAPLPARMLLQGHRGPFRDMMLYTTRPWKVDIESISCPTVSRPPGSMRQQSFLEPRQAAGMHRGAQYRALEGCGKDTEHTQACPPVVFAWQQMAPALRPKTRAAQNTGVSAAKHGQARLACTRAQVIWIGDADVITPPAMARHYHARIAGSRLHVVPHEGHLSLPFNHAAAILSSIIQPTARL